MTENKNSGNNSENLITRRFPIVARFYRKQSKSLVMTVLLSSCFYFAWIEPASRAAYVQMTGVVVTTLLNKSKK